jgi:hypothetical protein
MQHHTYNNLLHIGCGASIESTFYGGQCKERIVDWFELGVTGFVASEIVTTNTKSTLRVDFVESQTLRIVKSITVVKELSGGS